jgi:hypothetical protein
MNDNVIANHAWSPVLELTMAAQDLSGLVDNSCYMMVGLFQNLHHNE